MTRLRAGICGFGVKADDPTAYKKSLVSQRDLSKVNVAFFNVNGWVSLSLMALVIADCVWV